MEEGDAGMAMDSPEFTETTLTLRESYLAMLVFLEAYHERGETSTGSLLGDLQVGIWEDSNSADPAQLADYVAAFKVMRGIRGKNWEACDIAEVDSHRYLWLDAVSELKSGCNVLRLEVSEGRLGEPEDCEIAGIVLKDSRPVLADRANAIYRLTFHEYAAYSITNESCTEWDDYGEWTGTTVRQYSRSRFLEYVKEATIAEGFFSGPLLHYELVCLDHIVDVVANAPPIVEKLTG